MGKNGGEVPSCSLVPSGAWNFPEKGTFSLSLAEEQGSIRPVLWPGRLCPGRNGGSHPRLHGTDSQLHLPMWLGCRGPARTPRGLFSLALVIWVKWLEGSLPLFLSHSPSLCFSLSPALWAARPLITRGRHYRPGSNLPPKPAGLIHADGWQAAPSDKLIRPNLSTGRSAQASVSDFPPPAFLQPPGPRHWKPRPCPIPAGPQGGGREQPSTKTRRKSWVSSI